MRQAYRNSLDDYAAYHRDPRNKLTHYIGIPMIVLTLISLLRLVDFTKGEPFPLDAALLLIVPVSLFYLRLNLATGIGMAVIFALMYLMAPMLSVGVAVTGFCIRLDFSICGPSLRGQKTGLFQKCGSPFNRPIMDSERPVWKASFALLYSREGLRNHGSSKGDGMGLAQRFSDHITQVQATYEKALTILKKEKDAPDMDAVLIHSGSEGVYFADDRHLPFEAFGHFRHWLPLNLPDQMVLVQPGQKPKYFQVVPTDFWYEQGVENESWWADQFDLVGLKSAAEVMDHLPATRRIAFLGENTGFASHMGLPANLHNEVHLTNFLDYYRGMKTAYELDCLKEANAMAVRAHQAAFESFQAFGSEYDIHQAFLAANQMIEHDSPYTNIVGLDEKSAILHYQHKRRNSGKNSQVLLIDAGCRCRGYCSDITRTYVRETAHPVFRALVEQMDALQLSLVSQVRAGMPYIEIHTAAHDGVLDLLLEHDIVRGSKLDLKSERISKLFFPHGIGHLLGIQVHDVGGFFGDQTGALAPPPQDHPFLRLNRIMAENMVFTIEPGLYFIPVLLEPERNSERGKYLNWSLVDTLTPYGGIRFEDNIIVTAEGPVNLTR